MSKKITSDALARMINREFVFIRKDMATKQEVSELKSVIDDLRSELLRDLPSRPELQQMKTELLQIIDQKIMVIERSGQCYTRRNDSKMKRTGAKSSRLNLKR